LFIAADRGLAAVIAYRIFAMPSPGTCRNKDEGDWTAVKRRIDVLPTSSFPTGQAVLGLVS
jgi:hypothetical protein